MVIESDSSMKTNEWEILKPLEWFGQMNEIIDMKKKWNDERYQ